MRSAQEAKNVKTIVGCQDVKKTALKYESHHFLWTILHPHVTIQGNLPLSSVVIGQLLVCIVVERKTSHVHDLTKK